MKEIFSLLPKSKNKKKIFLGVFATILAVSATVAIVAGINRSAKAINKHHEVTHAMLKSTCSNTLYPDLCFSSISALPDATTKIKTAKDVIHLALNVTKSSVVNTHSKIKNFASGKRNFTMREKAALKDCIELLSETLDEIDKVIQDLHNYPSANKSKAQHAEDFKIFLSAAMTNQETCLDGFSHDKDDEKIRDLFIGDETNVRRHCSNNLAMIKNITDTDMANEGYLTLSERKPEEENGITWPEWLSASDRRLLQATTVTPNVVVAADGSGDFRTVSEAVKAAPEKSDSRYIIRIKAGVYKENVEVPSKKTNIMFLGDGRMTTIITGDRNVVDGSTTFNSATVAAVGGGFLARDITFQNSAGPSKHQAVALRVGSDLSAFYRCNMLAYQDTLYVHSLRQFYTGCNIVGTVDFIFGNAAALFQDCIIQPRRPNPKQKNMVTAQGRTDPNQNTGIVIQKCKISATQDLEPVISSFPTYLGRPWKLYSRTVIMQTEISHVINPAGWFEWDGDFALDTLTYREYRNTGAGADTTNRVTWKGFKVITNSAEAKQYTARNFISGSNWLHLTGFPFSLDL